MTTRKDYFRFKRLTNNTIRQRSVAMLHISLALSTGIYLLTICYQFGLLVVFYIRSSVLLLPLDETEIDLVEGYLAIGNEARTHARTSLACKTHRCCGSDTDVGCVPE